MTYNQQSTNSSFDEANCDLVFDQIDPNMVYSVSSLTKHYVFGDQVSVNDPYEGFLDLTCIKNVRLGCVDPQVYAQLQQIAMQRYAFAQFEHANIVSLVYGTTFAENKTLYMLGMKRSVEKFYEGLSFLINGLREVQHARDYDERLKWLKDLYLNLFYDNANKKFQCTTPMQALLAFGGRQFNFHSLEANFNSAVNNILAMSYSSTHSGNGTTRQSGNDTSTASGVYSAQNGDDVDTSTSNSSSAAHNPQIVIQHKNSIGTNSSSSSSFQKRKSSTSITSLRFGNTTIAGAGNSSSNNNGTKSSSSNNKQSPSNGKGGKLSSGDTGASSSSAVQKVAKLITKTPAPPMIDRIAKFRAFKQKSLAIEMMFARSSSGASSLEHQTSFDEASLNATRTAKKSIISVNATTPASASHRMGVNGTIGIGKKATVAFRVPNLFSLVNNR